MPEAALQSPLVACGDILDRRAEGAVTMSELAFLSHALLRGEPNNRSFTSAVKKASGLGLPKTPNTIERNERYTCCWLGPDEWLIYGDASEDLVGALEKGLAKVDFCQLTDQSSGQTVLRLEGAPARTVIQRLSTFDVHPRAFKAGQCAQTRLEKMNMLIVCRKNDDDDAIFDLILRRSFADYACRVLDDAMVGLA